MRGNQFFAEISKRPPFTKLHPDVAGFFKDYFTHEKVVQFGEQHVVNTHFPPYPSRAFDNLANGFAELGEASRRRLYSITLAVTNRCSFDCWHCYNAGRSHADLDAETLRRLAADLQHRGAVMVTLTGGEPLLRDDLESIAASFDDRSCVVVGTTGDGLTPARARQLRDAGVFGVGISLDSLHEAEHDRLRRRTGAFQAALRALRVARDNGLYSYCVAVATREFLAADHFMPFMRMAGETGALEVHLLEPCPIGNLAGQTDVRLTNTERQQIFAYQELVAADDDLPILSSYAYLESASAFGCGAGLTHLYIDGSGEVCPCQFVPLSFGNITNAPLDTILAHMGRHFQRPRTGCVGKMLAGRVDDGQPVPAPPNVSARVCEQCLPADHPLPTFFKVHSAAQGEVGANELKAAYDRVHSDYDEYWLKAAARPIDELVDAVSWNGSERVFEAGCGTGYATTSLARHADRVVAVDLSEGMLSEAARRLADAGCENVRFVHGDALATLTSEGKFDVVFTSWVLGYIPLRPFFEAAARSLTPGGILAFVVHRENSPREPLEVFAELVARDPAVLQKRVGFDFPRDAGHIRAAMDEVRLETRLLNEGVAAFHYDSADEVLDHLLKSGAGTAFYDAIAPDQRAALTAEFLRIFARDYSSASGYEVRHEYVACVARKVGPTP